MGHSITLALTSFGVIVVSSEVIEFPIPLTICVTAALNVVNYQLVAAGEKLVRRYLAALFFGFIHGMGFSIIFALLFDESTILVPLLGFNLRSNGQLLIVFDSGRGLSILKCLKDVLR